LAEEGLVEGAAHLVSKMQLSQFDYILPSHLIAEKSLEDRSSSRMLVAGDKKIHDKDFTDIVQFLKKGDVLVLNNSKVIPARLEGFCEGKKLEITLIKKTDGEDNIWSILAKPAKKLKQGSCFEIGDNFYADIISKDVSGEVLVKFNLMGKSFFEKLHECGSMPLPPYIAKKRKPTDSDKQTYQTVYADINKEGSVAAPTAGLHFTPAILDKIRNIGVEVVFVTLHVGAGTFFPVRVEDIKEHKMHSEYFEITPEVAAKINIARNKGGKVIAVGTTSLRVLESAAEANGNMMARTGDTDIFIYPGYGFKIVDILLTNFHLPRSTLYMLVSAFMGIDNIKNIYHHAIGHNYRFFSYGDCSLLFRDKIVP